MGFGYDIQYKAGMDNLAADTLSRVSCSVILSMTISIIDTDLIFLIKKSYHLDNNLINIVEKLHDLA